MAKQQKIYKIKTINSTTGSERFSEGTFNASGRLFFLHETV